MQTYDGVVKVLAGVTVRELEIQPDIPNGTHKSQQDAARPLNMMQVDTVGYLTLPYLTFHTN